MLTQLLVSFVVGGCLITLLSLIAEKVNENISGIIMMFPSTIVLGFFFLGYTTSANNVSTIIPATLVPLGIVIFSSVIYIYCSLFFVKYFKYKVSQIAATIIVSSIIWFILASPFAIFKFTNLVTGVIGFFVLITLSYIILNKKRPQHIISRPIYNKTQITIRAIFTGFIIATVVFLGKTLNPFWGGVFTMFPAATFATLMILHFYYEPNQLFYFMKKAPIGSLSLFLYAISVMVFFPKYGIVIGSLFSYFVSLIFSLCLIKYNHNRHNIETTRLKIK